MMLQLKPVTDDVIRVSQNDELVKKDVALAADAAVLLAIVISDRQLCMYADPGGTAHTELYYT